MPTEMTALDRRRFLHGLAGAGLVAATATGCAIAPATPARRLLAAGPAAVDAAGQTALPVWAYDGQVPGPVLRFKRGEVLDLDLLNGLPDPTTIHWHGIRLPNAMDGVPDLTQPPVAPGARFRYRFALPDAGTFWYHPHLGTPEQVDRGLAGALIVEDDAPPPVDADIVWVIDDWRLDREGRIADNFYHFHDVSHAGRLGQVLTVNGQPDTTLALRAGQRVRLRLINAANARIFALALDGLPGWLIARDGVPADRALAWDVPLFLGPGMRADLIVDASQAGRFAVQDRFGREPRTLATIEVSGTATAAVRPAPTPAAREPLPEPELRNALAHTLTLGGGMMSRTGWPDDPPAEREARRQRRAAGAREADPVWTINGHAHMGPHAGHAPAFRAARGQSVRLTIENPTAWWHPMHLHGHHVKLLARNGQPLPEQAWRDTVLLAPRDRIDVAFVADNPGAWLIHCHVLEHHAGGMGTVFEVAG